MELRHLPDPVEAQFSLQQFSVDLHKDINLLRDMETILCQDVPCKECVDTMIEVLSKLSQLNVTNLYYKTVKTLLQRIASVIVDRASIKYFIYIVQDFLDGRSTIEGVSLPPKSAGERGLKLLTVLANIFSVHFQHDTTLRCLIDLLNCDEEFVAPYILKALTHLGRHKPLIEYHADLLTVLAPICKKLAISGTPKQAKHAIQCMHVNTQHSNEFPASTIPANLDIFPDIIDSIQTTLVPEHECYLTAIVALGHIAFNMPNKFVVQVKNMISSRIVKGLLLKDSKKNVEDQSPGEWCDKKYLHKETQCKIEAIKTMARWLFRSKHDISSAQKTFRMLSAFIEQQGDLLQSGNLSPAEKSWIRLSAGKAMLKICEQRGIGDQYSIDQFYTLSKLMIDPVIEVREIFAKKLHKGLSKEIPHKCLPLDFMGFYALAGHEKDHKLQEKIKAFIEIDVNRRRNYLKAFSSGK